jgi:hypothetical protein
MRRLYGFGTRCVLKYTLAKILLSVALILVLVLTLAPLWYMVLLFGIPYMAIIWWPPRRPPPPGHCAACGYDLTGNLSGRCPECGATAADSATSAPRGSAVGTSESSPA